MRAAASAKRVREPARHETPRAFVSAPPDTMLFASVAMLVAIGLVMIFSASSAQAYADMHDTAYYVKHQLIYLCVGLGAAYVAYRIDYRKLRAVALRAGAARASGLVAVFVPHVGLYVNGGAALDRRVVV